MTKGPMGKPTRKFDQTHVFHVVDTWANVFKMMSWIATEIKGEYSFKVDMQDDSDRRPNILFPPFGHR